MLVLTRKAGESIRIGNNVTVSIVRSQGNRILVGIDAPNDMPIVRAELLPVATRQNGKRRRAKRR
jgi:carbon storage regulator